MQDGDQNFGTVLDELSHVVVNGRCLNNATAPYHEQFAVMDVSTVIRRGRERITYSLPLQVLRYRMRWFKVSDGRRLPNAPKVMSSIRSTVRDLHVLAIVMAFVGVEV